MRLAEKPHFLYRCYDSDGHLLYVGVTSDLRTRMREHLRGAPVGCVYPTALLPERMAFWTAERHPDRQSGFAAERAAIRAERPEMNIKHNEAVPA